MDLDIIWEKTKDGTFAYYQEMGKILPRRLLKQIALSKILDVKIISAEFHEISAVFEPQVLLLLDGVSRVEFFGTYDSSDESDESDNVPSLCCRKVTWSKRDDWESFNASDKKSNYILTDKQLVSEICFLNTEQQSNFESLTSDILEIFCRGVKFEEVEREEVPCRDIKLQVFSLPSFSCSYHLFGVECQVIEGWIPKWRSCFEKLDSSAGYMPDSSKIRISYNRSFFDYLEIWKKNYQE